MLIGIWLTTACNLRCKYCYEGSEKKNLTMNKQTAERCCQYINELDEPLLIIQFHGGEPLLNYDVLQYIVKTILSNKKFGQEIMFGITTNGILLTKDRVEFLSRYMTFGFSISIDGNRIVNNINRITAEGNGSYDLVAPNIPLALSVTENIRFRMTFNSKTISYLSNSIIHLINLGAKKIVSHPDYFDKDWSEEHLAIYKKQLEILDLFYKENIFDDECLELSLLEFTPFKKTKCTGGYGEIHVSPDGILYPCTYVMNIVKYRIGSIEEGIDSFRRDEISKINERNLKICEGCTNYESCLSVRCRYLNEMLTGCGLKPSPIICAFERENINFFKSR